MDLALNKLQNLICHKIQANKQTRMTKKRNMDTEEEITKKKNINKKRNNDEEQITIQKG